MTTPDTTLRRGRVIANLGYTLLVEADDGETVSCIARKSAGAVICGDRVDWQPQAHGTAVITAIHPRTSLLSRPDQRGKARLICANIDRIVVAGVIDADSGLPRHDMLDSYLVAAEALDIEPVIVINKIDLVSGEARERLDAALAPYHAAGYPVVLCSVIRGDGLDMIRSLLQGHRSVVVGESGVGKSSLIDRLVPGHALRIGELSQRSGQGRHTTTVTMLFHLPDGGDIIDSPGVREFRLWPLPTAELAQGFREFRDHLGHCRYRDCRHLAEPDCALVAAVEQGLVSSTRLESYRDLLRGSL